MHEAACSKELMMCVCVWWYPFDMCALADYPWWLSLQRSLVGTCSSCGRWVRNPSRPTVRGGHPHTTANCIPAALFSPACSDLCCRERWRWRIPRKAITLAAFRHWSCREGSQVCHGRHQPGKATRGLAATVQHDMSRHAFIHTRRVYVAYKSLLGAPLQSLLGDPRLT